MRNCDFPSLGPMDSIALWKGCQLDCWAGTAEDEAL